MWSIQDHISSLATDPVSAKSPGSGSGSKNTSKAGGASDKHVDSPTIGPRGTYQGHGDTVEDVQFCPSRSADTSVRMFDRRNLTSGGVGSPVHIFEGHNAAVLCVQWSPDRSSVFGSSAEDGILNIWDHEKIGKKQETVGARVSNYPPGLFFRHAGHRDKVVDFHWNSCDPWTIVSVSDDGESTGGGGTLQIWRMIDLIYRPEEEVLAELDKFKSHILTCA